MIEATVRTTVSLSLEGTEAAQLMRSLGRTLEAFWKLDANRQHWLTSTGTVDDILALKMVLSGVLETEPGSRTVSAQAGLAEAAGTALEPDASRVQLKSQQLRTAEVVVTEPEPALAPEPPAAPAPAPRQQALHLPASPALLARLVGRPCGECGAISGASCPAGADTVLIGDSANGALMHSSRLTAAIAAERAAQAELSNAQSELSERLSS